MYECIYNVSFYNCRAKVAHPQGGSQKTSVGFKVLGVSIVSIQRIFLQFISGGLNP